jgi:hypothetical protein
MEHTNEVFGDEVVAAHGDFTCKFHKTASKAAGQQMY